MDINQKGQYLSAEQMLLFSMGVVITVSVYFSFSTVRGEVEETVSGDVLREAGNSVASGISWVHGVAKGQKPEPDYINLTLEIPKSISEKGYKIKTKKNKLLLVQGSKEVAVPLANGGGVDVKGEVHPGRGRLHVVFKNSTQTITLER